MDITGIEKSHQANSIVAGKKSSKKEWKLSDSLREKIIEYAREDAAQNVYMGNKFLALRLLFGEPYEAKFQSEGTGSAVHVYDGNGDEILTYTAGVGWHEKESKAETQVHGALKAAYYDAYHAARQEINSGIAGMEVQGGFDARA